MTDVALDELDRKILEILQKNARIPNTELADEVGLTPAPCLRRVKKLEESGVINRYSALLEPKKVGKGLMVMVTLDRQTKAVYDRFTAQMRERPEVLECLLLLGDRDFLLKVRVADLEAYQHFYLQHLTVLEGIRNVNSLIVVSEEKLETALELG